jgi:hypothetical protein
MDKTDELYRCAIPARTLQAGLAPVSKFCVILMNTWTLFPVTLAKHLVFCDDTVNTPYKMCDEFTFNYKTLSVLDSVFESIYLVQTELCKKRMANAYGPSVGVAAAVTSAATAAAVASSSSTPEFSTLTPALKEHLDSELHTMYAAHCIRRNASLSNLLLRTSRASGYTFAFTTEPSQTVEEAQIAHRQDAATASEDIGCDSIFDDDYDVFDDDSAAATNTAYDHCAELYAQQRIPVFVGHLSDGKLCQSAAGLDALHRVEYALRMMLYPEKNNELRVFVTLSRLNIGLIVAALVDTLVERCSAGTALLSSSDIRQMYLALADAINKQQCHLDEVISEFKLARVPVLHVHIQSIPIYQFEMCSASEFRPSMLIDSAFSVYTQLIEQLVSAKMMTLFSVHSAAASKKLYSTVLGSTMTEAKIDVACDEQNYTLIRLLDTYPVVPPNPTENKDYKNDNSSYPMLAPQRMNYKRQFQYTRGSNEIQQQGFPDLFAWPLN